MLGVLRPAHAVTPSELYVGTWRTDAKGTVAVTFDGNNWQHLAPPSKAPARAIYQSTLGLWAVTLDDGRTAYVEARSFRNVQGRTPCERAANTDSQSLETRNFGDCP
jgi:hypothetical protein